MWWVTIFCCLIITWLTSCQILIHGAEFFLPDEIPDYGFPGPPEELPYMRKLFEMDIIYFLKNIKWPSAKENVNGFKRMFGKYKSMKRNRYPNCSEIKGRPKDFIISGPATTLINTCGPNKATIRSCICKVVVTRTEMILFNVRNCQAYGPHQNGRCDQFTYCYAGTSYVMLCQNGTLYNPAKKACDHPQNVQCRK